MFKKFQLFLKLNTSPLFIVVSHSHVISVTSHTHSFHCNGIKTVKYASDLVCLLFITTDEGFF